MLKSQPSSSRSSRVDKPQPSFSIQPTLRSSANATESASINGKRLKLCSWPLRSPTIHIFTTRSSIHVSVPGGRCSRTQTCSICSGPATSCQSTSKTSIDTKRRITFLDPPVSAAKIYSGVIWIDWGLSSLQSSQSLLWASFCQRTLSSFRLIGLYLKMRRRCTFWSQCQLVAAAASKLWTISRQLAKKRAFLQVDTLWALT